MQGIEITDKQSMKNQVKAEFLIEKFKSRGVVTRAGKNEYTITLPNGELLTVSRNNGIVYSVLHKTKTEETIYEEIETGVWIRVEL